MVFYCLRRLRTNQGEVKNDLEREMGDHKYTMDTYGEATEDWEEAQRDMGNIWKKWIVKLIYVLVL